MLILTTVAKNWLLNPDVKLKSLSYTLFASNFSYDSMSKNFRNRSLNWINTSYVFTNDFRFHILIQDDRLNIYKVLYIKSIFEKEGLDYEVPFLCISDIKNLGEEKEQLIEKEQNWLVINLNSYDIKCSIYYDTTTTNISSNSGNIINKHFHKTGDYSSSEKIRKIIPAKGFSDVSVLDFSKGYKSLFSRGYKSFIRKK